MKLTLITTTLAVLLALTGGTIMAEQSALDFTVNDIDGNEVNLSKFGGDVVMIVNVASKCGFTSQYEGLQELYTRYRDKGFVILGFPANNFGGQEPGTNAEIKQFCTSKYDVEFPMFAKISVKGKDKAPLYEFLTSKETNPEFGGTITWNFNKFLIGRDGKISNRFDTRTAPLDDKVLKTVAEALQAPAPDKVQ